MPLKTWRYTKWPCLRDWSYNLSWLAADLPEAISSLLMLFHIKQVWEWVTWLAQISKVIASVLLGNVKSSLCLGVADSVQTSAIILQQLWGGFLFHFSNFRLHLAFTHVSSSMLTWFGTESSYTNTSVCTHFLCLGDTEVERRACPVQEAQPGKERKPSIGGPLPDLQVSLRGDRCLISLRRKFEFSTSSCPQVALCNWFES